MQMTAIVSGKVQGVYFRISTQQQAIDLGLKGYAKNLDSGDVEVVFEGSEKAVKILGDWLQQGPEQAEVEAVEISETNKPLVTAFFVD